MENDTQTNDTQSNDALDEALAGTEDTQATDNNDSNDGGEQSETNTDNAKPEGETAESGENNGEDVIDEMLKQDVLADLGTDFNKEDYEAIDKHLETVLGSEIAKGLDKETLGKYTDIMQEYGIPAKHFAYMFKVHNDFMTAQIEKETADKNIKESETREQRQGIINDFIRDNAKGNKEVFMNTIRSGALNSKVDMNKFNSDSLRDPEVLKMLYNNGLKNTESTDVSVGTSSQPKSQTESVMSELDKLRN